MQSDVNDFETIYIGKETENVSLVSQLKIICYTKHTASLGGGGGGRKSGSS